MKLPESEGKIAYEPNEYECEWISSQDAYTANQMLQMRIDTLEEAAEIERLNLKLVATTGRRATLRWERDALRTENQKLRDVLENVSNMSEELSISRYARAALGDTK